MNERPDLFAREFLPKIGCDPGDVIEWLSPLKADDYAEYRDQAFLQRLRLDLKRRPLLGFWPNRGPVWDGLARGPRGEAILVEAKAHIRELYSPASVAREASLGRIRASLAEAKRGFRSTGTYDWSGPFYQYTNRLAHLHLLRTLNQIPAKLVFLYFVNAQDVSGPTSVSEWEGALKLAHTILGLNEKILSENVVQLFVDVRELGA